jgi:hypothetical protein
MKRILICLMLTCSSLLLQSQTDQLYQNFLNPPKEYKPGTWMHAMSSNMSKVGMTKDLEAIQNVGIGKVLLFNVTQGIPVGPVKYASTEHFDIINHAIKESDRLGLDFGVHNCDGWTSSGGPWVTPEMSMKMFVWTEKMIKGGKQKVFLDQPTKRNNFYKDIAIIAYPTLSGEIEEDGVKKTVTSSDPKFDVQKVLNQAENSIPVVLNITEVKSPYIEYNYEKPINIRSATIILEDRFAEASLHTSQDGKEFTKAIDLLKVRTGKGEWAFSDNFAPILGKHFRVVFTQKVSLKKVQLTSQHLIKNFISQNAMARTEAAKLDSGLVLPNERNIINPQGIIILGIPNKDDQYLDVDLPTGEWTLMRFGYTTTGAQNSPASAEGRGLEIDKYNKKALDLHFQQFVEIIGKQAQKDRLSSFKFSEIDSYEMGGQNWTDQLPEVVKNELQIDLLKYLPALAGKYIEDVSTTTRFLDAMRGLYSKMMVENYFGHFRNLCNNQGIKTYVEPYGFGPFNYLDAAGQSDYTMGEFWMNRDITMVRDAVDAANIYGKKLVSAESFTSQPEINWAGTPRMAKTSGDRAWIEGINEFMFHRFAHQPNTKVEPGMTMNKWGFHFDRTQPWWNSGGKSWFNYMARGQYLLRQGHTVSDVMVFIGDQSPNSTLSRNEVKPTMPLSVNYTCVNNDVLTNRATIVEKKITLPEGAKFPILHLSNTTKIKLATLKKLVAYADQGLIITGELPTAYLDFQLTSKEQDEFVVLKNRLSKSLLSVTNWENFIADKVGAIDLVENGKPIPYIHRQDNNQEIYFISNSDSISRNYLLSCRVGNKVPELWDAMTGTKKIVADFHFDSKITTSFELRLQPGESKFIVFRKLDYEVASVKFKNQSVFFDKDEKKYFIESFSKINDNRK